MPVWLYFSSFLFYCVFFFLEHETIELTIQVLAVFENPQKLDCPFVVSLRIFVIAPVKITSITALGMFTNLFLVLLLLLAGSLAPKFHFKLAKKKVERSPKKGRTYYNLADNVTALAQLYADSERYIRTIL